MTAAKAEPKADSKREAEPAKPPPFQEFQATVTEMDTHHRDLWEFYFKLDKPIHFVAGQYVSIFLEGIHPLPFSIASSPVHHDTLGLGIEIVGEGTTALSHLKPDDTVTMKGPFGHFVMGEEPKVCFLSGGVGVTPFICMMRWIRDTSEDRQATMLYSCKKKDQFLWFDELEDMNRNNENLHAVFTLTKEEPDDWPYRHGRITPEMIKEVLPDYKEHVYFCCGPEAFINGMQEVVKQLGVPDENFRREAWH
ncbi:MAG: FAD-dependent oxidoreductase [Candidatus Woesearchaeota archaeon]|nr:FAD-dependent oxidoreductase [Candidatus Woesearchaeota archaeon]